jgi:hypothetical protein
MTRRAKYEEEDGYLYQPFTTTDLLNWQHHILSFTKKPQALIDLM